LAGIVLEANTTIRRDDRGAVSPRLFGKTWVMRLTAENNPTLSDVASRDAGKAESLLLSEARAGKYDAFEELVDRYERKIYRLALNLTGSPEDAEDVLQETFLKAFEHLSEFREDSRFYTWIVRIAINEGLMKLRKRRASKEVASEDAVGEDGEVLPKEFADWRPNPEQVYARKELQGILQAAARALPTSFRAVFFLRDVEGLSTEETAETLGLSTGAVKARLFRARLHLREELSKIFKRG
jgi:RNA polymerase sigma-70 factor (ECF subfamily)